MFARFLRPPRHRDCTASLLFLRSASNMSATPWVTNKYPSARRSDHVHVYRSEAKGSVHVADPYQWLEKITPETESWIKVQEEFTRTYLDQAGFSSGDCQTMRAYCCFLVVRILIASSWRMR
jgi:hypothetical protein